MTKVEYTRKQEQRNTTKEPRERKAETRINTQMNKKDIKTNKVNEIQ